ncbi:Co2+/Mg2+ efflux protein ApaG [Bowmanella denitrificans]|uniref:Co2+/Mg2+ efflux protein ApaG n=1 Tax=Bowmanella denitrificans TaxID=366582 RepID=UPI000C9AC089
MKSPIVIHVKTEYLPGSSNPAQQRFAFAYHISITNMGNEPAQLLNRYWLISDANGKVSEVSGAGVVGKQPHIGVGETYEYSSGAILDTPVGSMQGYYEMQRPDGERFQAPIAIFRLAVPNLIN